MSDRMEAGWQTLRQKDLWASWIKPYTEKRNKLEQYQLANMSNARKSRTSSGKK